VKYFAYSPVDGIEFHDTADKARAAAAEVLAELDEAGFPGGDSPEQVCWGVVKQRGKAADPNGLYADLEYI
jgi:hypothetical protein